MYKKQIMKSIQIAPLTLLFLAVMFLNMFLFAVEYLSYTLTHRVLFFIQDATQRQFLQPSRPWHNGRHVLPPPTRPAIIPKPPSFCTSSDLRRTSSR